MQIMLSYCMYSINPDNSDILLKFWNFDKKYQDISKNIPGLNGFRSVLKLTARKQLIFGGENGYIYLFDWTTRIFKENYQIHDKSINII